MATSSWTQRAERRAEVYRHLTEALGTAQTFTDVAQTAVEAAAALIPCDGASATVLQGGAALEPSGGLLRYVAATGAARSVLGRELSVGASFTGQVVRQRRAELFAAARASSPSRSRAARDQIRSGAVAPVVLPSPSGGRVAGTLGVVSHTAEGPRAIDEAALRVLDDLAAFIGRGLAPLA